MHGPTVLCLHDGQSASVTFNVTVAVVAVSVVVEAVVVVLSTQREKPVSHVPGAAVAS
jgi:hypothetical protein